MSVEFVWSESEHDGANYSIDKLDRRKRKIVHATYGGIHLVSFCGEMSFLL